MEDELQELRDLIAQLKADNEKLRQERVSAGPSVGEPSMVEQPVADQLVSTPRPVNNPVEPAITERLVFVPRDRKCPSFSGKSGISIDDWVEEAQACMRARHLTTVDQAFFLFDHLVGEARDEIKFRSSAERKDPDKIIAILREIYGCSKSYVALQEAFFSRKQQEEETLQEFSLALMMLMSKVKQAAPDAVPNADQLLRDQFAEHVLDGALRRELKQLVRRQPSSTLLEVRAEAIRWVREGLPGGTRERSYSLPSTHGIQYGVQGSSCLPVASRAPDPAFNELKEILKRQQEQLNQLTQSVVLMQRAPQARRPYRGQPLICRRCQRPGHFARECDGERVPQPSQSSIPTAQALNDNHHFSASLAGN